MKAKAIVKVGPDQEVFRGKLLRIITRRVQLPNGIERLLEQAERPPGVRVIVVNDSHILMTKEWRVEINGYDYRLPGGKVFDSLDDYLSADVRYPRKMTTFARQAAQKELREETGVSLQLKQFRKIHRSACGATLLWDLYFFYASMPGKRPKLNAISTSEGEETVPVWIPIREALELCVTGKVQEDRSVAALVKLILGPIHLLPVHAPIMETDKPKFSPK